MKILYGTAFRAPDAYELHYVSFGPPDQLANPTAAQACQVLFIADADNLDRELAGLANAPVLTVGDEEGMAARGVMIELIREGPRIAFKINLNAARPAGLTISSQLLKLAREVY